MISKWDLNIWRRVGRVGKLMFIEYSREVVVKSLGFGTQQNLGPDADSAT